MHNKHYYRLGGMGTGTGAGGCEGERLGRFPATVEDRLLHAARFAELVGGGNSDRAGDPVGGR